MLQRRLGMYMRPYHRRSICLYNYRGIHTSTSVRSEHFNESNDESNDVNLKTLGSRFKNLETQMEASKTQTEEAKLFKSEVNHKFENFALRFEHRLDILQKETGQQFAMVRNDIAMIRNDMATGQAMIRNDMAMGQKETSQQLEKFSAGLQKQLLHFFARGFFGILGIAALLIGGAWVLPVKENERLEVEMKKRAIIRDGADRLLQK